VRLALINYEYPPLGGGAGNATAAIARALARQDHEVSVLTSGFGSMVGVADEAAGLRTIRLPTRRSHVDRSNFAEMLSFTVAAARALPAFVRNARPDGLIVFFTLPCGPLGWLAKRSSGAPYVISLRGGDVPGTDSRVERMHRVLTPVRRAVLRGALSVVANSRGLAELSQGFDPTPVDVIPNGVDAEFFSPAASRASSDGSVGYLFAGRFQPQKNLFVLLEQFGKAIRATSVPLTLRLIGDGADATKLKAHARDLGIADHVQWTGWLDKEGIREAYRAADVFVNPSLFEGMPNTVLEAMACGLPVIASRVMGNDEVVEHGDTGILFDLTEPDALARAIADLATSPARRSAMGIRARLVACSRYSWEATARQYADLFSRKQDVRPGV
jgi:glycosyltransferase involved in cell wall biosynthesis